MIDRFKSLNQEEFTQLKDSIALIAVLIAGADGKVDPNETEWAEKITNIRSYSGPEVLQEFYEEVGKDFHDKLMHFIIKYEGELNQRNEAISERLQGINPILAKLDEELAAQLYKSLVSFASHVAKSSGGVLGFFSVSEAEKDLLDLNMINAIEFPEEH